MNALPADQTMQIKQPSPHYRSNSSSSTNFYFYTRTWWLPVLSRDNSSRNSQSKAEDSPVEGRGGGAPAR